MRHRRIDTFFSWEKPGKDSLPITDVPVSPEDATLGTYNLRLAILSVIQSEQVSMEFSPAIPGSGGNAFNRVGINERIERLIKAGVFGERLLEYIGGSKVWCSLNRQKNEPFGEAAIRTAIAVFEAFGVKDAKRLVVPHFRCHQITYFKYGNEWLSYEDCLRKKFGLVR